MTDKKKTSGDIPKSLEELRDNLKKFPMNRHAGFRVGTWLMIIEEFITIKSSIEGKTDQQSFDSIVEKINTISSNISEDDAETILF